MAKVILILLITIISSCSYSDKYKTYDDFVREDINTLKSPVVLIAKSRSIGRYNIVLKDSIGKIAAYGNMSYLADAIGESHNIGDTIK